MAVSVKDQEWQAVFEHVAMQTDANGMRIDIGIMGLVLGLNASDIRTTSSCEGHLGHGWPYPWVNIVKPDSEALESLLESFYQCHPMAYDRMLTLEPFDNDYRLRPHGSILQESREPSTQDAKLREYQAEMYDFALFLKRRFFGEEQPGREHTVSSAADLLGMRPETLTQNILRKNLAAEKRGRDYFISHEELMRFKNAPRRSGRPAKA